MTNAPTTRPPPAGTANTTSRTTHGTTETMEFPMTSSTAPDLTAARDDLQAAAEDLEDLVTAYGKLGIPAVEHEPVLARLAQTLAAARIPRTTAHALLDVAAAEPRKGRVYLAHDLDRLLDALDAATAPVDPDIVAAGDAALATAMAEDAQARADLHAAMAAGRFDEVRRLRPTIDIDIAHRIAEASVVPAHHQVPLAEHVLDAGRRRHERAVQAHEQARAASAVLEAQLRSAKARAQAAADEVDIRVQDIRRRESVLAAAREAFVAAASALPSIEDLNVRYAAGLV